jgi:hypothetical protein
MGNETRKTSRTDRTGSATSSSRLPNNASKSNSMMAYNYLKFEGAVQAIAGLAAKED